MLRPLLGLILVLGTVCPVAAADVPVEGHRLRLVDLPVPRRSQMVSYNTAIDLSTVNPAVTGATLDIYSTATGQQLTLSLPAGQWAEPSPGRLRFEARGNPTIKVLLWDQRLMRVVLIGAETHMLGQPQSSVAVRLTIGTTRFCTLFGGIVTQDDGERFVARHAPAPTSCPAAPNDP